MLPIPRRKAHFVFAVIQSGLTTAIASGIGTWGAGGGSLAAWLASWFVAWALMTPVVLLLAPFIQRIAAVLTREGV